jgi:hypothetical protein
MDDQVRQVVSSLRGNTVPVSLIPLFFRCVIPAVGYVQNCNRLDANALVIKYTNELAVYFA